MSRATRIAMLEAQRDAAARDVAYAVLDWMSMPSETGLFEIHRRGRVFRQAELRLTTAR